MDDDVDLALRHVSRLWPGDLARAVVPAGTPIVVRGWLDTQVAARQRRLDRAFAVDVAGAREWHHDEFQTVWTAAVPQRVWEYHGLLATVATDSAPKGRRVPSVRSVVVLLTGRETPWPAEGEYRTTPLDAPFGGLRFRIDAVYQRTVDELRARASLLWLAFAPLCVDVTPAGLAAVIAELRARVTDARRLADLAALMVVLAEVDGRQRGLRPVVVASFTEEIVMQSWIYTQGLEKGLEQGIEQGMKKGRRTLLRQQFERRLSRILTPAERATFTTRCTALGATRMGEVVVDMTPKSLAAWLADPAAT